MQDFITDEKWELFTNQLLSLLNAYQHQLDLVGFLGQIKQKLDDCSRCYTGSWIIEMLYKTNDKHTETLGNTFALRVNELKQFYDREIVDPIRQQRQDFICQKCMDMFYAEFKGASKIISREKALALDALSDTHRWNQICKMCADKGLLNDEEYKSFLGKIMVEMVKY